MEHANQSEPMHADLMTHGELKAAYVEAQQRIRELQMDPVLQATVTVLSNGQTKTRLSFGKDVRFSAGRAAVVLAASALEAEIGESSRCPAGRKVEV